MQIKQRLVKSIPPGVLAVSLLIIYLFSLAPGLTWANYGADGGDLVTAAATGGIAHPTGYPVYLILARLFQFFPTGSLAFRTNLMSAIAMTAAALLVYSLVAHIAFSTVGCREWLAALVSGYAFGLAPLVWSQAVITEVYGLHALFVIAILYLSSAELSDQVGRKNLDRSIGLVLGLAAGNHLTSALLFPLLLFRKFIRISDLSLGKSRLLASWQLDISGFLRELAWLGIGLLVYITIPLRSLLHPPVNWGNPGTSSGFLWLVSGKLYQEQLFVLTLSSVWERCKVIASLLLGQFGIMGLAIGLLGLIVFFKPSPLYRNMIWTMAVYTSFSIIYATSDSFLYLIPVFMCFAICIGIGLSGLMELFDRRFHRGSIVIGLVFILILFVQAATNWAYVDASHDQRAEQFGGDVMRQAPDQAIVFAKGDRAVFTLWYFQFALHKRLDLAIVAIDLLHFDWYQQNLRITYPDLNVPGPFPFAETMILANPDRPKCYVEYQQLPQIQCLPVEP
jgi:hypothetical protein